MHQNWETFVRHALPGLGTCLALLCAAPAGPIDSNPFVPDPGKEHPSPIRFTRLGPELTRLDYSHEILAGHPDQRLYASAFAAGNLALGDLDLDGVLDLFVSGGPGSNKIYLQAEGLVFVDVSSGLQITDNEQWAGAAVMVDIDNDSDLDIYVCYYDKPNKLYVNQVRESGRLWFQEKARDAGLDIADASLVPAFADLDRDGDLDLYLVTHQLLRKEGRPSTPVKLDKDETGDGLRISGELSRYYELDDPTGSTQNLQYHETGRPDRLLLNDKGKFRDISRAAGIAPSLLVGNSAVWWDADADGFPDLYVGNDGAGPDQFYRNKGNGTFTLDTSSLPRTPVDSRGCALFDADLDGSLDLLVADSLPDTHFKRQITVPTIPSRGLPQAPGNALFLATAGGHFREIAWISGLAATGSTSAIKAGDFDQDGREDLFFATGAVRNFKMADLPRPAHEQLTGKSFWELYEGVAAEKPELNRTFRNLGGGRFQDVSQEWGLAHFGVSHTCSQGDLDNDGDLDLIVASLGEPLVIYRNDGPAGHSIRIRLIGTRSNRQGIGARVSITTPAGRQVRELRCGGGFLDGDEASLHFGTGDCLEIPSLEVQWPSGIRQRFTKLAANRVYTITEEAPAATPAMAASPPPWFAADPALSGFRHPVDSTVADFAAQPLLPFAPNATGPAQAWGDVDGDDDLDLQFGSQVICCQTGPQPGQIRLEAKRHRNSGREGVSPEGGSVFLDLDNDGDLDLYQASASADPSVPELREQLLFNWERGVMGQEPGKLPPERTATFAVAAADFDRDGDTDIFAGGRPLPGAYPLPGACSLLINENGQFRDAAQEVAPDLARAGLVNSCVWTDLDGDGWLDLVLATEWGPLLALHNQQGRLQAFEGSGLEAWQGRWMGVASEDLDQDGDFDLVATNLGQNTPYQASPRSPALLFYGRFEGMAEPRLVEALLENGVCFPRRNWPDLAQALPFLASKVKSHRDFASTPLHLLLSLEDMKTSTLRKANELRSGIFWNDGSARFQFTPLPQEAQLAPGFGLACADVNLDGALDLFLAQNCSATRPGLGPFRGGVSTLLINQPSARSREERFRAVSARLSGIALGGDVQSVAFVDVNGDRYPDLVAGVRHQALNLFLNQYRPEPSLPLAVLLRGLPGNPTATGARVQIKAPGLPRQCREVQAGSGYLTSIQGGPLLFARRPGTGADEIEIQVRWPHGEEISYRYPTGTPEVFLHAPRAPH